MIFGLIRIKGSSFVSEISIAIIRLWKLTWEGQESGSLEKTPDSEFQFADLRATWQIEEIGNLAAILE